MTIILTNLSICWGIYDWLKFTLTCIVIYIANFYFKYYTRSNPLPGPFPIPIIGTLYALKGGIGNGLLSLQKQYELSKLFLNQVEQEKLLNALKPFLYNQATILIKGSRSMKMEKVVAGLIEQE